MPGFSFVWARFIPGIVYLQEYSCLPETLQTIEVGKRLLLEEKREYCARLSRIRLQPRTRSKSYPASCNHERSETRQTIFGDLDFLRYPHNKKRIDLRLLTFGYLLRSFLC